MCDVVRGLLDLESEERGLHWGQPKVFKRNINMHCNCGGFYFLNENVSIIELHALFALLYMYCSHKTFKEE